jgi:hypothetical protein
MNKQFWISGVVVSVVAFVFGFVVHGLLLGNDYKAMQHLYRTPEEAQNYFHFMLLAHVLFGFAFTWIYRQGGGRRQSGSWTGDPFWYRDRAADDDTDLHHLLRGAAAARRDGRQADRFRHDRGGAAGGDRRAAQSSRSRAGVKKAFELPSLPVASRKCPPTFW